MSHQCHRQAWAGVGDGGWPWGWALARIGVVAAESPGPSGSHRAASGGEEGTVEVSLVTASEQPLGGDSHKRGREKVSAWPLSPVPFLSGCKELGTASPPGTWGAEL